MLDVLGVPTGPNCDVPHAVSVIESLTRIQKLDFWMRNPDYLADELLTEFEKGRVSLPDIRDHVARMLTGSTPSLHTYRMERYLYGAYEFIDNALGVLKTYGQITFRREADTGTQSRKDVFLLERGKATVARMRAELPELEWYDQQAAAIALIADAAQGASARNRQYDQPEYKATAHGDLIPSISDRVKDRAVALTVVKAGEV